MGGASRHRALTAAEAKRRLLTLGRRQARLRTRLAPRGWGSWLGLGAALAGGAMAGGFIGGRPRREPSRPSREEQAPARGLIAQIASIALPMLTREAVTALVAMATHAAGRHEKTETPGVSVDRDGEW